MLLILKRFISKSNPAKRTWPVRLWTCPTIGVHTGWHMEHKMASEITDWMVSRRMGRASNYVPIGRVNTGNVMYVIVPNCFENSTIELGEIKSSFMM